MNAGNLTSGQRARIDAAVTAVLAAGAVYVDVAESAARQGPAARLADAGRDLDTAMRALRAAWPSGDSRPGPGADMAARLSGVLVSGGRLITVTGAAGVRDALRAAAGPGGHDSPHWASGPQLGAAAPVHAVCVCGCPDCCGHRAGSILPVGRPGRCAECSCYLAAQT